MKMPGKPKNQEVPEELFIKTKQFAEEIYNSTNEVFCPYLKENIRFNASGLEHIKFSSHDKARVRFEQYTRLKLFYLVPEILKKSHTVQGVYDGQEWERERRHGKWQKILKDVKYYEFVAVIGRARIKIIVRKLGEKGSHTFWSIIPFWKMVEINGKPRRVLHDGNLQED